MGMGRKRGAKLPLNRILVGDCIEELAKLPAQSIDLVFADRPIISSSPPSCSARTIAVSTASTTIGTSSVASRLTTTSPRPGFANAAAR